MPIPNITTVNRLPRLGKIRLGEKRLTASKKEYPAALDHFSFIDVPEVEEVFGKTCREIYPVMLPHDDEDVFFPTARKAYRRSGLWCACSDGETANRIYEPEDEHGAAWVKQTGLALDKGEMYELPCPGEDCPYTNKNLCKPMGRFLFMLPTVPRVGVYEISTGSINGMRNILSTARMIKSLVGHVAGLPFALVLKPQQVQPDGMAAKTVQILHLEYRGSLQELAARGKLLSAGGALALLPASGETFPDDLIPHAGDILERTLNGEEVTASGVVMPKPLPPPTPQVLNEGEPIPGKAVTVVREDPNPHVDKADEGPDLTLESQDDGPEWIGKIHGINEVQVKVGNGRATRYDIQLAGGPLVHTTDTGISRIAANALRGNADVAALYEKTKGRGVLKLVELRIIKSET